MVFVLLSKFDMNCWLTTNPSTSERAGMITLIMMALNKIGADPNAEGSIVLENVRGHMLILLSSNITEYYSKVLQDLLNGSAASAIATVCWNDFICCLGLEKQEAHDEYRLSIGQVIESIHFLAEYFQNIVDKSNHHLDVVYETWDPYTKSLNKLLFGLFDQLIHHTLNQTSTYNKERALRDLWDTIVSVYQPWILPRTPGMIWTLLRTESVICMIQSFTEATRLVINLCVERSGYCLILNCVWTYYFQYIVPSVKEEQSLEMFHSLLATLPWTHFYPSVHELSFVLQVRQ